VLSVSLLQGMRCYSQEELRIRSRQAPISMRIRPRQAGAKLTFLSWLGPTGGAANRQRLFLTHFHNCIMPLVLNSKLVNSDHLVAGLLIGALVRGFRICTRVRKALKKKMPSKLVPLRSSSFRTFAANSRP
jgi:hypothetical protein